MSECIVLTVVRHSWENFSPGRSRKMILFVLTFGVNLFFVMQCVKRVKKLLKVSVCCYAHGCVHVCTGDVVGEGAVDSGGPRREFFRLLASQVSNTLFIGNVKARFFVMNAQALQVCDHPYFICMYTVLSAYRVELTKNHSAFV